ncbi:hypothetical protein [Rufibacter roseus]|uniref:Uncharacterized protein n=1 Tax=Rufibacter roseus TaxID=1567108 RepID=A0ABW2DRA4_9BACT|nr:hypothetical protein [Rufibacter roseus]
MQPFYKKLPILLVVAGLFASCSVEDLIPSTEAVTQEETQYTIKSGAHETTNPFKPLKTNKIKFSVKFDKTAKYSTKDPNNQADINKLYGMADCNSFHHTNSARFGWRWYQGKLELHAYSYANGVNSSKLVSAVDLDKWYTCEIKLEDNKYVFQVGNQKVEQPRGCDGEGVGYQLYPYFGGDETAPHEINILIKNEK